MKEIQILGEKGKTMGGRDVGVATRDIVVPEEFWAALAKDPAAAACFNAMSAAHRREYAEWVAGAKRLETRASRAEKALAMVLARTH